MPHKNIFQLLIVRIQKTLGLGQATFTGWFNPMRKLLCSKKNVASPSSLSATLKSMQVSGTLTDPRSEYLQLFPTILEVKNNLPFTNATVIFYNPSDNPSVNQVIQESYSELRDHLERKHIDFIYPHILRENSVQTAEKMMNYFFPGMELSESNCKKVLHELSNAHFFSDLIGFEKQPGPCFIHIIPNAVSGNCDYHIYHLPFNTKSDIEESIGFFLLSIPYPHREIDYHASVGNRNFENDPDIHFELESSAISSQLEREMTKELMKNPSEGVLKMMLFLLHKVKDLEAPMVPAMQTFIEALHQEKNIIPSRLKIFANGEIELVDFHKKIKLNPLQLTVFIFFLKNNDGIYFKDLASYKEELMKLYSIISNRSDIQLIQKSVNDLISPFTNSMSEKCSRIKAAFLHCIDDRIAQHYYIAGDRNQPKRIKLDRTLISFDNDFYKL